MNPPAPPHLFSPLKLGALDLGHRIFLACRRESLPPDIQDPAASPFADYYAARSTEGGLVTCTVTPERLSHEGQLMQTGLQTALQVNRWRKVTDAIHARGGLAVARVGNSPWLGVSWPDADQIDEALVSYRTAAENAGDAGFDGVELVGTRGSLPEQLLRAPAPTSGTTGALGDTPNTDFLAAAIQTLLVVWPRERVGLAISFPEGAPQLDTAGRAFESLSRAGIAYTHFNAVDAPHPMDATLVPTELRQRFPGAILVSGEWSLGAADAAIRSGLVDAVGPHFAFEADADLPEKWRAAMDASP